MFVYTITHCISGKVYVGKSSRPARRWSQHKQDSKSGSSPLYRAMRKYGVDAFEFCVVEECESEEASYDAEARWIQRLNCLAPRGYNLTAGGTGVTSPSAESRRKMSVAKLRFNASDILALQADGLSIAEIAESVGCSTSLVHKTLKRSGRARARGGKHEILFPAQAMAELEAFGASKADIAKHLGCSLSLVYSNTKNAEISKEIN